MANFFDQNPYTGGDSPPYVTPPGTTYPGGGYWPQQPSYDIGTGAEMRVGTGQQNLPRIGASDPAVAAPYAPPSQAGGGGQTPSAALQALLASGMNPQQAAAQINQQFGLTTGNEAVYYGPEAHGGHATVGLPGSYFSLDNGQWGETQRGGGGGGGTDPFSPFTGIGPFNPGQPFNFQFSQNDPSYQFRFQQGEDALRRAQSKNGVGLTGGALKELVDYGQGAASQEYNNEFQRQLASHGLNFGEALQTHQTNFNEPFAVNQNLWGQNFNLANLGLNATNSGINAATGQANMATGYANNAGNLYGDIGNATAAGRIGRGNAWNNFYGNLANLGLSYF